MSNFKGKMVHCELGGCTFNKDNVCTRDYIHINFNGKCIYDDSYFKNFKKESTEK